MKNVELLNFNEANTVSPSRCTEVLKNPGTQLLNINLIFCWVCRESLLVYISVNRNKLLAKEYLTSQVVAVCYLLCSFVVPFIQALCLGKCLWGRESIVPIFQQEKLRPKCEVSYMRLQSKSIVELVVISDSDSNHQKSSLLSLSE